MEEMNALVITSTPGSDEAIPPWAESHSFDGSAVNPSMFFGSNSDLFDMASTSNCLDTSHSISTHQNLLIILGIAFCTLEHKMSLE
jgi:hypothetical protein